MEHLLAQVTQQAMNYAIRSGIAITGGYAISQCSRFLKTKDYQECKELERLQQVLEGKIRIISPAIDMIELIAARGNSSLESAVALTKTLRSDIQTFGNKLYEAAEHEELCSSRSRSTKSDINQQVGMQHVLSDLKKLLQKIEDAVPLVNLAITTSGVSLSSNMPVSVSPSRLLQASVFLSGGDAQYNNNPFQPVQIGPRFTMSMYMLFSGHAAKAQDEQHFRNAVWKEVIHKAQVKLVRISSSEVYDYPYHSSDVREHTNWESTERANEFAYQLVIVEDLDDGRLHETGNDEDSTLESFDDILKAGIREVLPIHQVSKIFYADTGRVLNLGGNDESNSPVVLLKRDSSASPPPKMVTTKRGSFIDEAGGEVSNDRASSLPPPTNRLKYCGLPPGLDPEWIAFEVYVEDDNYDSDSDCITDPIEDTKNKLPLNDSRSSVAPLVQDLSELHLDSNSTPKSNERRDSPETLLPCHMDGGKTKLPSFSIPVNIRTSLSLLEMLIRLASLQQFQQASHLTINDELLNFFLEDSRTTGAATGDSDARKRIRMEARQRVGFDPYDESPIRRRGETYQHHNDIESSSVLGNQLVATPNQTSSQGVSSSNSRSARSRPRRDYPALSSGNVLKAQSSPTQPATNKLAETESPALGSNKAGTRSLSASPSVPRV